MESSNSNNNNNPSGPSSSSSGEGGIGGSDKVMRIVKVIHDHISKNHKGRESKSIERITYCYFSNCLGDTFLYAPKYNINSPTYNFYSIGSLIVQSGDPINVLGNVAVQAE
jgi:hypothetical protein